MHKDSKNSRFFSVNHSILAYLPVVLVAICLVFIGLYIDRLNTDSQKHELRSSLLNQVSAMRARLEGEITANALLVKGLVVALSLEPNMTQKRFIALSSPLLAEHPQIQNIAAAPDLIIRYVNPVEGNEAAIGLNYRTVADQLKSVEFARDTGELVMTGPVNLVQGGRGLIIRMPVFSQDPNNKQGKFWGIISTVIEMEKFFSASGLYNSELGFNIAIRNKGQIDSDTEDLVFGDKQIFESEPLITEITLPQGTWELAAMPKDGWLQNIENINQYRIILFVLGLMIIVPLVFLTRMIVKRRESEERLQLLFKLSPVGIALNSYDTGDFIDVNNALLEPTGYSYNEFLKLSYWDITPEKYKDDEAHQLETLEKTGQYGPYEKEYIKKDGSHYPVLLKGMTIHDSSGNKMIWSFIEDISQRNQAQKSLQRSQKMDAIGQLTGGIAHDFNNILGVIIGNTEMLQFDLPKKSINLHERINSILDASHRAADLTKQLLSFSRKKSPKQVATNINNLVDKMQNLIARSVTPEVEVSLQLETDLWLVKIDQGDFEDVMLNLSINARDAMSGHGSLIINTRNVKLDEAFCELISNATPGEYIELAVSDTGVGIPSEQLDHMFEPFFTTKEEGKGTGLGLAMVYGFIQRSKGYIDVKSKVGSGTTIKLYLPRFIGTEKKLTQKQTESDSLIPRGTETLLVVDDEEALLNLAKALLEGMGYSVYTAANGKQALEMLHQDCHVDLLFTDVVMPGGINGYQLAEQAVASFPKLKVLFTSGYTGKIVGDTQAPDEGITLNLLSKPYSRSGLARKVREVLDE